MLLTYFRCIRPVARCSYSALASFSRTSGHAALSSFSTDARRPGTGEGNDAPIDSGVRRLPHDVLLVLVCKECSEEAKAGPPRGGGLRERALESATFGSEDTDDRDRVPGKQSPSGPRSSG